jgi:hypothetical protein
MTALPVRRAHELEACPEEQRWLIEGLWAAEAVGILGGEPKCCKSFLALDMAVAVASGAPCLRRFPTTRRGRVLLFAAEDSPAVVRQRLTGIASAVGAPLDTLDIHVIVAPVLRLDVELDQRRLEETVGALRPMLLVLDPFVRLHRIDENVSSEVAPLLDYLRGLQRRHRVAVVLVHHARKGAAHVRAGQALRGSSELHAWGDSNLYVRRSGDDDLSLTIEHRAARSADGIRLTLHAEGDALALRVTDSAAPEAIPPPIPAIERVERILAEATSPVSQREIRDLAKIRASTVGDALAALVTDGRVSRIDGRYQLTRR